MNTNLIKFLIVFTVIAAFLGCGKKQDAVEINQDFSRYISGFTSGLVSAGSVIQIEFTQDLRHERQDAELLFSFSPAVKGTASWKGNRTVEFVPAEPLREGTRYVVSFNLEKLIPGLSKDLHVFRFDLNTIEQDFSIAESFYQPIDDNQNRFNNMLVELSVADALTDAQAQSVFSAQMNGNELSSRLVNSANNGRNFRFLVDSIERGASDAILRLTADGRTVSSSRKVQREVTIHAINADAFNVISVQSCELPERCLKIVFTDPLANQDLTGLLDLGDFTDFTVRADRNVITVFPENDFPEIISGRIDRNIKSFAGKNLRENFNFTLEKAPERPLVRMLSSGVILPSSQNLLLAFSAVNLRAVELRIIKIYEHNVLGFLQRNSLNDANELTRFGRLVARRLLPLDGDKSKNLTNWNNFAVDISALVERDPGAIFRYELIIRQEFSLFPCDGDNQSSSQETPAALDESNFVLSERDMLIWDRGGWYSPPIEYDWENYDWRETENPCHPTFYMEAENVIVSGNLFATNVGVIAKKGDSEILVSAQDIRTTKSLSGASVRVLNFQLAQIAAGTTDRDGFSLLNVRGDEAFVVEVSHGGQKGYLRVSDGNELSLSRFDISGRAVRRGLKGFLYGERGIWRPGDEIFFTFILNDRQNSIPAGHPVTMDIYNPQGQFFRKLVQSNPVGNFYSFAFSTQENSPTGLWRAVVSVGGTRFERSFRVETIKPNRLKINIDFGTEIIERRDLKIAVDAQWLHGAIARDLETKVLLRLTPAPTRFNGFSGYVFSNPVSEVYSYESQIFSGNLNEEGRVEFTASLPQAEMAAGMLTATFTTTVEERGGGESMTINSIPYSPFRAYIGLNTHQTDDSDIFLTDTTHYFDVAMLDARGNPIRSGELIYRAYKLDWSWWLNDVEARSRMSSVVSGNHITPVIDQKVNIVNGRARIPFRVTGENWGRYLIYIKDPHGGHATGRQIFADDPRWGGRSRQDDPEGLTMLSFTTDKQSYNVGEEAVITIGQGGRGRVLTSLENGSRVLRNWWTDTREGHPTVIRFRITEDLAPNFYIHLSLLQLHGQTTNDLPIRMYGVVPVTVVNPQGRLNPTISMPDVLRSENEFTVTVGEANRQNMSYTLAIVDEGLLDINNFRTPDPYAEFNAKEALGVKTFDRYNHIIGAFSGELRPLFSVGGGEDTGPVADKNSQRFKPVVMFMGPFDLRAGRSNQHKVQLPPYIGSVRVMVVAGNENQAYGNAEKTVPVQNPLMVLTTLPRVLGPNEEVLMPVNVFVTDKSIRNVRVDVRASDLLELSEAPTKNISFSDAGDELIFFRMRTKGAVGQAQITVTATAGRETSTETTNIEIRNPNPLLTVFNSFVLRPSESIDVNYEFDAQQETNRVQMEYARIPAVNLSGSLQYLLRYPHGCSEQITSRGFPQLFLHNFSVLDDKQKQDVQDNVNAVIRKLYTMQTSEGGISYWSGSSQADEWVTSYVGHFMSAAREQGYSISQSFINNWQRFQNSRINNWNSSTYRDDHLQSYRLYSLAAMGSPNLAAMNRLRERPNLSPLARWQLAAAYAIIARKDAARQLINNQGTQIADYSAFNSHFGSRMRDEAIILETLVLLEDMEQALTVARRISAHLNSGSFSTQTTAWALLAMARFAQKSGAGDMNFTTTYLGKVNRTQTQDPVVTQDLEPLNRSGSIRITNNGTANIYVGRTMTSTPLEDRSEAVNNNLRINVKYADMSGNALNVTSLNQGADFVINVSVTNTSPSTNYTNLALTHIIPSGWEIFNTRLGNESATGDFPEGITYQDIRDDRVLSYFDLAPGRTKTVSIRVQAAYLGRFFKPAIACYAMYDNTVYARTAGTWVEVVR